jgi:hypothetical protein
MREWPGNEISADFAASLPAHLKPIVTGSDAWPWRRLYT